MKRGPNRRGAVGIGERQEFFQIHPKNKRWFAWHVYNSSISKGSRSSYNKPQCGYYAIFAPLILLHNLYCVMIQRYNLTRRNLLLTKKNKKKNIS